MTDARFPERWLNDRRVRMLTDQAFRLFVYSLVWSVANRTDGVLYDNDLPLIPDVDQASADELIKWKLWQRDRDRWVIVDYAETQTSRDDLAVLESARRSARERQRRHRAAIANETDTSRDGHADMSRDSTRTGQAKDRHLSEGELAGTSDGATCLASNCVNEPRHGLLTCWDHAALEPLERFSRAQGW